MKKCLLSILFTLALLFGFAGCAKTDDTTATQSTAPSKSSEASDSDKDIVILYTNDVYCEDGMFESVSGTKRVSNVKAACEDIDPKET